jgi:hypothetical protein
VRLVEPSAGSGKNWLRRRRQGGSWRLISETRHHRDCRRSDGASGAHSAAAGRKQYCPISVDRGAPRCQRLSWTGRAAYDCRGSTAEAAGRKCPDSLSCLRRPREWEQGTLSLDARRCRCRMLRRPRSPRSSSRPSRTNRSARRDRAGSASYERRGWAAATRAQFVLSVSQSTSGLGLEQRREFHSASWDTLVVPRRGLTQTGCLSQFGRPTAYIAVAGATATGGAAGSARSSAGLVCRLKLSALLIRPT